MTKKKIKILALESCGALVLRYVNELDLTHLSIEERKEFVKQVMIIGQKLLNKALEKARKNDKT